ncbi:hypothetical protein PC9H_011583 [Pleurotus ostreatus]|uniref:Uncharacterized protein n=1 Tax=Pleurotus ostreatus TaxID=5322 RepID=A0A8H7DNB0_PLEOS|nr:uncharacterized protein PC9H_011583 [Pleurotus ostreatus]KAF7421063.1 hypothetical protein PC9H_011583 [Pleurotus ostreatus]
MAELHRIQELDLFAFMADCILLILNMHGTAGAPLLQRLRLKSFPSPIATSMPPDILRREIPCLHRLELEDMNFSPALPPFPHLRYLSISLSTSTITPSSLLTSIQYAPNLRQIHISGMANDRDSAPTTARVRLPHLVSISITSNDMTLNPPPSSPALSIPQCHRSIHEQTGPMIMPDLSNSNLISILRHIIVPGAALIQRVELSTKDPGQFQLSTWGPGPQSPPSLVISLALAFDDHYPLVRSILCHYARRYPSKILALEIQDFSLPLHPDWESIFNRCNEVARLRFSHVRSDRVAFPEIARDSPGVLGVGVRAVIIKMCSVTEDTIENLSKYTKVDWDGTESVSEDEEEKEGDSEDEYDFECGFGAV